MKAATTRKPYELKPRPFTLTTRLKPSPTDAFSIGARKSHAPAITASALTMGKTNPDGRAIRTFAEASILGSSSVEGTESRPATTVIFSSLPIFLSRNQLKMASSINFREESSQPQRLLIDKLRTQYTRCHSCVCFMSVTMRRMKKLSHFFRTKSSGWSLPPGDLEGVEMHKAENRKISSRTRLQLRNEE